MQTFESPQQWTMALRKVHSSKPKPAAEHPPNKMATSAAKSDTTVLSKSIPIRLIDLSIFDDNYSSMRERFVAEMKRCEDEMNKFSSALIKLYVQTGGNVTGMADQVTWDSIVSSPLVSGEGEYKILKLQFDVSQFDPTEVHVRILDNVLMISASHKEKSDTNSIVREMKREFLLPKGTNAERVISSISRDGVLTIQAPLPHITIEEHTSSTESTIAARGKPTKK